MHSIAELTAPFALLLPVLGLGSDSAGSGAVSPVLPVVTAAVPVAAGAASQVADDSAGLAKETEETRQPAAKVQSSNALEAFYSNLRVRQIRIEQRVIVRIAPQRGRSRQNLLAQLPQRALSTRYEERKTDKCLPVERIAGVQTGSGNRLLLFLRDSKIISLNLEKACRARDFYSGFYVERAKDGQLCVDRDKLQSRNGANCEIDRMMQLVALED